MRGLEAGGFFYWGGEGEGEKEKKGGGGREGRNWDCTLI